MRIAVDHRDAILEASAALFARRPYHEVLMDHVADKVGVAKGTVYRYYETKEDLFAAVALFYFDRMNAEIAISSKGDAPPLQRLHATMLCVARLLEEHKNFFQVMQQHECELFIRKKSDFAKRRAHFRGILAELLNEAQARGEVSCPFDTAVAGDMLMGMIRNVRRLSDPPPPPEKLTEMALHIFIHGLAASPASPNANSSNGNSSNGNGTENGNGNNGAHN
jgi:AcrR family transcriptional regulator